MKNYIMKHINVIITALRILLAVAAIMAVYNIGVGMFMIIKNNRELSHDFLNQTFNLPEYTISEETQLAGIFAILYGVFLAYLIYGIKRFYKCMNKIKSGKMFYNDQREDFKKAGAAVITFAKAKFVLYSCTALVLHFDIPFLFKQILPFLGLYLTGKLLYIMAYMAEKGEFIQEENELTI